MRCSTVMASRLSSTPKVLSTLTALSSISFERASTRASSSITPTYVANVAAARASISEDAVGIPCHYALFEMQPAFDLDLEQLSTRYRELARKVHPDRYDNADVS